jgi:hypothetical protein
VFVRTTAHAAARAQGIHCSWSAPGGDGFRKAAIPGKPRWNRRRDPSTAREVAMKLLRLLPFRAALIVTVCSLPPAWAGDWYVDAVSGNDANSGASPASAWRTITHAHATLPLGAIERIHIAPGLYDAALGESFPISIIGWHDKRQFVGDAGSANTVLDGGGASAVFQFSSAFATITPDTVIRGLSIRNAGVGIAAAIGNRSLLPVLTDLDVSACGTGISVTAGPSNYLFDVQVDRVHVHHCNEGLSISNSPPSAGRVSVVDSAIDHHATFGVSTGRGTELVLQRTRVEHNGAHGVITDDQGFANVQLGIEDCLVANNGANGIELANGLPWTGTTATLARCTIANNAGSGVSAGGSFSSASLSSCIVYGNGDDLATAGGGLSAQFCDIGDGDFAGSNGNFAADPLFVDAAGGDWRLSWGSPCAETGDPATAGGVLDLAGLARPIDGDLDTLERFDVGAHELAPLFTTGTGQAGTFLVFELWGPQGAPSTVYWTAQGLVPPLATPYGELELFRRAATVFRATAAGSGPPVTIRRVIPHDPALYGRTFAFQAMTLSSAAPLGRALTNASEVTIVP